MSNKIKNIVITLLFLFVSILMLSACDNGESHIHEYGEWIVTKEATCTEMGEKERSCFCGYKQTRVINAKGGHSYGEWIVEKEATCTQTGEKYRICSVCNNKETKITSTTHSYGEWIVKKKATCTQTGEKYRICSVCNNEETENIPLLSHTYDEGYIINAPTCTSNGSKRFTCTVCGATKEEAISSLGHSVDNTEKCSRCGLAILNMTNSEIADSKKVQTMSYGVLEYSDEIYIQIYLKDKNLYNVQVPVYVDVKIVDDNGNILYSETIIKKSSQDNVSIYYDEITKSLTNTGTLYYTVYNDYFSFETVSEELERIPWTVTIELPKLPQTISDTRSYWYESSCIVTEITYKISNNNLTFYLTGKKTYDQKGNDYSQSCKIGWRLYDEDGYVIDSGTCYTSEIAVGDKFKNVNFTIYDVIEQGKTYKLVITDVS